MKKWKSILLISAVCALCAFPVQASEVDSAPAIPIPTENTDCDTTTYRNSAEASREKRLGNIKPEQKALLQKW